MDFYVFSLILYYVDTVTHAIHYSPTTWPTPVAELESIFLDSDLYSDGKWTTASLFRHVGSGVNASNTLAGHFV